MFSKRAKAPKPTREDKKDRRIPLSKYARGGRISSTIGLCNGRWQVWDVHWNYCDTNIYLVTYGIYYWYQKFYRRKQIL